MALLALHAANTVRILHSCCAHTVRMLFAVLILYSRSVLYAYWILYSYPLVGLNPWHFTSSWHGGPFQPGMVGMPAVLAAYKAIGKEIVSRRQGEIDFSQFGLHGGGNDVHIMPSPSTWPESRK